MNIKLTINTVLLSLVVVLASVSHASHWHDGDVPDSIAEATCLVCLQDSNPAASSKTPHIVVNDPHHAAPTSVCHQVVYIHTRNAFDSRAPPVFP